MYGISKTNLINLNSSGREILNFSMKLRLSYRKIISILFIDFPKSIIFWDIQYIYICILNNTSIESITLGEGVLYLFFSVTLIGKSRQHNQCTWLKLEIHHTCIHTNTHTTSTQKGKKRHYG